MNEKANTTILDLTGKYKFIAKRDIYQELVDIYGQKYAEYRHLWSETSKGLCDIKYPLDIDFVPSLKCNIRCTFCFQALPKQYSLLKTHEHVYGGGTLLHWNYCKRLLQTE